MKFSSWLSFAGIGFLARAEAKVQAKSEFQPGIKIDRHIIIKIFISVDRADFHPGMKFSHVRGP